MTHTLIPRAATCSAKVVSTLDFEKYWSSDILNDYIKSGFTVAAQCCCALAVDVTTGIARLKGLYIENTSADTITCLTACSTNSLYLTINRNCCCIPKNWTYSTNTTGCVPTDSQLFATAITDCVTVTSVCNVPSGREVIPNPFPNLDKIFGCGEDGCGVNPSVLDSASYKNLCITCNTTWSRGNNVVIRVSCTFTIAACTTLTWTGSICSVVTKINQIGVGGAGGTTPVSAGGQGGDADANLIIFANTVVGTGTILSSAGDNGSNGTGGAAGSQPANAGCAGIGRDFNGEIRKNDTTTAFFSPTTTSRMRGLSVSGLTSFTGFPGRGGKSGNHPTSPDASGGGGGGGGTSGVIVLVSKNTLPAITLTATGGNGGNGGPTPAGPFSTGQGQGTGGSLPWVIGGAAGAISPAPSGGGGAGGGGGAAGVITVTPCDASVTYTLTGGSGGAGGSTPGCTPGNAGSSGSTAVLNLTYREFEERIVGG